MAGFTFVRGGGVSGIKQFSSVPPLGWIASKFLTSGAGLGAVKDIERIAPGEANIIVATGDAGVYWSTDYGKSWSFKDKTTAFGGPSSTISNLEHGNGQWICQARTRSLYKSSDGENWSLVGDSILFPNTPEIHYIPALDKWFAIDSFNGNIYDGGNDPTGNPSWSIVGALPGNVAKGYKSFNYLSSTGRYVTGCSVTDTSHGSWSTDLNTWNDFATAFTSTVDRVACILFKSILIFIDTQGRIYYSTDGSNIIVTDFISLIGSSSGFNRSSISQQPFSGDDIFCICNSTNEQYFITRDGINWAKGGELATVDGRTIAYIQSKKTLISGGSSEMIATKGLAA